MPTARKDFRRTVRALPREDLHRLVAAVWAARGWETSRGRGHVVARRGDERVRIRVVADLGTLTRLLRQPSSATDIVVVRGRLMTRLVEVLVGGGPDDDHAVEILDGHDLFELITFAIAEDDRASIEGEILSRRGRMTTNTVFGRAADLAAQRTRLTRGALIVLGILVLVVSAGPAGPLLLEDPSVGTPAMVPTATAISTPGTPPLPTVAHVSHPEACPPPPASVHPATLAPSVLDSASSSGLDGWELLITQTISEWQFDPNDQRAHVVPEERHIAIYAAAPDEQYRLVLDRWPTSNRTEQALADNRADLAIAWGRYVLAVHGETTEEAASEARAMTLLAGVSSPGGPQLGLRCVTALAAHQIGTPSTDR